MMCRVLCLFFAIWCWPFSGVLANQVSARVLMPSTAVLPGDTVWMGLELSIAPGWNTYWQNPGATGLPPTLSFDGVGEVSLWFPTPLAKPFGDDAALLTYGYSGAVVHPFQIQVPPTQTDVWILDGRAQWLVCREICIPESQNITARVPVVSDPRDLHRAPEAERIDAARSEIPTDFPARLVIAEPNQVWIEGLTGVDVLDLMPETSGEVAGLIRSQVTQPTGIALTLDRPFVAQDFQVATWVVRTSDGGVRIPLDPDVTLPESLGDNTSLAVILALAFAGGFLLNLMPCVFPVLSMKALSIAASAHRSAAQVRAGALLYGVGILVSMALLAGAMGVLQATGAQIGWGFQLQTPWFVAGLVYVFVVLALSLYGWVTLGGSFAGVGQQLTEGRHGRAEFFTGVLAVVVATPCTAPLMGVAMGYTLTQPWSVTLLVFFALGLGLASPMLVFGLMPELARRLPRPGPWMERLKQALAFPMLATAIWLLWVVVRQTQVDAVIVVLGGLLLLVFGLWLQKAVSRAFKGLGWLLVLLSLFAIPLVSSLEGAHTANAVVEVDSEPYTSSQLRAHLAEGRSVFVNMTADWCITCKVTEQRLLNTEAVQQLFDAEAVVRMTGDWTRYDATITAYLNRFERVGVPLYVVHHPDEAPIVLSQFPTFAELSAAIQARSSP